MFEGISTQQWLAAATIAAAGAMLVALLTRPIARRLVLALWLLVPGLFGAAASSAPDVATLFGLFLFLQVYPGTLWVVVALPAYLLIRALIRWRGRGGPPEDSFAGTRAAPACFDQMLAPEEWRSHLCSDLVGILDKLRTVQRLEVVAVGVANVRMPSVTALVDSPLSPEAADLLRKACASDPKFNPTCRAVACLEHWTSIAWPERGSGGER